MTPLTKKDALIEGAKELGRVVLIAAVSAGLTAALSWASGLDDKSVQFIIVSILTAAGKAWDKYVHENPETTAKGIVPF
jgi:hypothetical protein